MNMGELKRDLLINLVFWGPWIAVFAAGALGASDTTLKWMAVGAMVPLLVIAVRLAVLVRRRR